jgi:hypothetical protein
LYSEQEVQSRVFSCFSLSSRLPNEASLEFLDALDDEKLEKMSAAEQKKLLERELMCFTLP